jgi:hypothetical protein
LTLPTMSDLTETILTGILTGLAADAMWESGKWAWKNRARIRSRLESSNPQPVLLSGEADGSGGMEGTLTVGKSVDVRWNVLQTVGKSVDLRWRVEVPTPSLAGRLEELASWYLHVS